MKRLRRVFGQAAVAIILSTGVSTLCGCGVESSTPEFETQAEEIAERIMALPAWIEGYSASEIATLNALLTDLRSCPSSQVEDAIVYLFASGGFPLGENSEGGRVFLIVRGLFAVPTSVPDSEARAFGGWLRPEVFAIPPPSSFNPLWPLTMDGKTVTKVDNFIGYFGIEYNAVGEFRYFRDLYGLR